MARPAADSGQADDPLFDGAGVRVSRATGCFRNLSWNLELEPIVSDWAKLRADFARAGWVEVSTLDGLHDFVVPEGGHHVVVVPRSEWIQLRLSYLVPAVERLATMRALAERISGLVTSRTTPPPGPRSARRSPRRRRTSP